MTESEWPTNASDYQIVELIGQGAFAKVYKARCLLKECLVAIKVLDLEKITSSLEDIRVEVQTMKMTKHPNILTCYCSFVNNDQLWLVMSLMNKGSCLNVMNSRKKKGLCDGLEEDFCCIILRQTLLGLNYFHENGQIHRDIKAGNILLDSKGNVLIADFGVTGWMMEGGDRRKNRQTFVGTPCWMAPEVMEQVSGYDYKADIWSFGITALELAKGYAPYAKYQPMKVLLLTVQEDPPSLKSYEDDGRKGYQYSRYFKDMIRLCLQKDPSKRPTTSQLLKHNFFKRAKDTSFLVQELLSKVDDIGQFNSITEIPPGAGPLYAKGISMPSSNTTSDNTQDMPNKYVPGTTWIFEDDEQIDNSNTNVKTTVRKNNNNDMSIDDFAQHFDQVTGGEKYKRE